MSAHHVRITKDGMVKSVHARLDISKLMEPAGNVTLIPSMLEAIANAT